MTPDEATHRNPSATAAGIGMSCLLFLLFFLGAANPGVAGGLIEPDPALTPGSTRRVSVHDLCMPDEASRAPDIAAAFADEVLERYQMTGQKPDEYEIDRLIPFSLGGSSRLDNLWPLTTDAQPWNATRKHELEQKLHFLLCHRAVSLHRAQQAVRSDWIEAYVKYVGAPSGALRYGRTAR